MTAFVKKLKKNLASYRREEAAKLKADETVRNKHINDYKKKIRKELIPFHIEKIKGELLEASKKGSHELICRIAEDVGFEVWHFYREELSTALQKLGLVVVDMSRSRDIGGGYESPPDRVEYDIYFTVSW